MGKSKSASSRLKPGKKPGSVFRSNSGDAINDAINDLASNFGDYIKAYGWVANAAALTQLAHDTIESSSAGGGLWTFNAGALVEGQAGFDEILTVGGDVALLSSGLEVNVNFSILGFTLEGGLKVDPSSDDILDPDGGFLTTFKTPSIYRGIVAAFAVKNPQYINGKLSKAEYILVVGPSRDIDISGARAGGSFGLVLKGEYKSEEYVFNNEYQVRLASYLAAIEPNFTQLDVAEIFTRIKNSGTNDLILETAKSIWLQQRKNGQNLDEAVISFSASDAMFSGLPILDRYAGGGQSSSANLQGTITVGIKAGQGYAGSDLYNIRVTAQPSLGINQYTTITYASSFRDQRGAAVIEDTGVKAVYRYQYLNSNPPGQIIRPALNSLVVQ
jgi:hypothetical protein